MSQFDWKAFCDTSDGYLASPHVKAGWKYATDSRIAIRCPTEESDTSPEARHMKSIPSIFTDHFSAPPVNVFALPTVACERCKSRGQVGKKETCAECEGSGGFTCRHCDEKNNCETCNGAGVYRWKEECPECRESRSVQLLPTQRISAQFVGLLSRCGVTSMGHSGKEGDGATFEIMIDDMKGQGIVLPMTVES